MFGRRRWLLFAKDDGADHDSPANLRQRAGGVSAAPSGKPRHGNNGPRLRRWRSLTETEAVPTTTRLRQSVLYSDHRKRSGGRRAPSPKTDPVEEHAGEVSRSEGPTVTDLSEFKALALNDTPPKLELTDSETYDSASSETYSEIIEEEKAKDESDFDLEEALREMEEYLQAHTYDTMREAFDSLLAVERATPHASCDENSAVECATQAARYDEWVREQPRGLYCRSTLLVDPETEWFQATGQPLPSMAPSRSQQCSLGWQPRCEVSDEVIIQNGINWMSEEAMVAFRKYAERSCTLTGLEYNFEELCYHCFNVECHYKIFHHYNFTVKVKNPSSVDWRVVMYFAEVKEIFGRKYYFCCPLESSENGQCYSCNNQGMNDLKHPATGGFERGSPDTVLPYMYFSSDDSDEDGEVYE